MTFFGYWLTANRHFFGVLFLVMDCPYYPFMGLNMLNNMGKYRVFTVNNYGSPVLSDTGSGSGAGAKMPLHYSHSIIIYYKNSKVILTFLVWMLYF